MNKILEISDILKKEVIETKICDSIILFGSAVYNDNPKDIDFMLYQNDNIEPINFLKYIEFMNYLDIKYQKYGFTFTSGKSRKKYYETEISILPYTIHISENEKATIDSISKNYKIIYGKWPFLKKESYSVEDFLKSINLLYTNTANNNYVKIKNLIRYALTYTNKSLLKETIISEFETTFNLKLSKNFKKIITELEKDEMKYESEFKKEFEYLYFELRKIIQKENPNINLNLVYEERYNFIIQIYRDLRILWEKENIDTIKRYLIVKQKEFENRF